MSILCSELADIKSDNRVSTTFCSEKETWSKRKTEVCDFSFVLSSLSHVKIANYSLFPFIQHPLFISLLYVLGCSNTACSFFNLAFSHVYSSSSRVLVKTGTKKN